MSSNTGLLYADDEGKIVSMDNVFEYDSVSNALNIMSSKVFDISKGILKMSPSQKASILEGVQQDIDIGDYNFRAKSISVSAFSSENLVSTSLIASKGILYTDDEGKIASMDNVFEFDSVSNTLNIMSSLSLIHI